MEPETLTKTIVDIILEKYSNDTWETIIPKLKPEVTKELHEVMDTIDILTNNGMFNLDDENDYLAKGFDIVHGWEDEELYDYAQMLGAAVVMQNG